MAEQSSVPRKAARQLMREAIRRGLVPGDRLASEASLMGFFNVSRGSLREALRLLSFLGAVDVRSGPSGGSRLALPGPRVMGSALAMGLQMMGTSLQSLLDASAAIEPIVASLAATHRRDQDLFALDACLAKLTKSIGQDSFAEENHAFRHVVAIAAGNDALGLLVPALMWISTSIDWEYPTGTHERVVDEKVAIAAAIRARDAPRARDLTVSMFARLLEDLQEHQPQQMATRIVWPDVDELSGQDNGEPDLAQLRQQREDTPWTR